MTERQALEAIAEQFTTNWPAASGDVTYVLENNALPTTGSAPFVLLTVLHLPGRRLTQSKKSDRRIERRGNINVKCWTPANEGTGAAADLMDAARAVFEDLTLSVGSDDLSILEGDTREVGTDGRWYMKVAIFGFRYYTSA